MICEIILAPPGLKGSWPQGYATGLARLQVRGHCRHAPVSGGGEEAQEAVSSPPQPPLPGAHRAHLSL